MVRFVDVTHLRRWVADHGVEPIIVGMVAALEDDFGRWPEFSKTPRIADHSPDGVIELMPASDHERYGFKYVNGHPVNPSRGLQTVTAFGVLADVRSGYPILVSEMTILTALRTAATSAMAARALARPDSRVMALIGTGSQSEFQALAFRAVLGINELRAWDTDPAALDAFMANAHALGFEVHRAMSSADAAAGADVITTCTADKSHARVLADADVATGVHINALGGDCPGKTELEAATLRRAAIFVEYPEQTRVEGEIQQLDDAHPVTELWRVLRGAAPGRTSAGEITVWDSVGFAIEDFTALRYLDEAVRDTPYCTEIDLVAEPADPKKLFDLVKAPTPVLQR